MAADRTRARVSGAATLRWAAVAIFALATPVGAQSDAQRLVTEAQRLVTSSNGERIAALEAMLDSRGLPYAVHEFSGPGDPNDPRPTGRNLVLTFGDGLPEVVVGAHADAARLEDGSLSHGMVDNAAGVVTLLELAESLRSDPPSRQVRVVFFDMEEIGLRGSAAFASTLGTSDVAAMVNVDIVGYGDAVLFGPDGSNAARRSRVEELGLAYPARQACASQGFVCISTPRMPPGDDRSFAAAGIPAVSVALLPAAEAHQLWLRLNAGQESGLRDGWLPGILRTIHTPRDTVDRLEPEAMARAVRLVTQLVRSLATGFESRPPSTEAETVCR